MIFGSLKLTDIGAMQEKFSKGEPQPFRIDLSGLETRVFPLPVNSGNYFYLKAGKNSVTQFTAGKISDDTNPLPSIDIGNGFYTELEFCIVASNAVSNGQTWQFRISANGTALDTYTLTPQWIVAAGEDQVSGANCTHSHSATTATFSQVHSYSIAGANSAHAATVATFSQVHNLAIAGSNHAVSSPETTVSEQAILQIASASHSLADTGATFAQNHVYVTENSTHVTSRTVDTFSQVHALTVQNSSHLESTTAETFTQNHIYLTDNRRAACRLDGNP